MKKIIYILVVGILMASCTSTTKNDTTISILKDVTETYFMAKPTYKFIAPKFGLEANKWKSVRFRFSTITSIDYNRQEELTLNKQQPLFGNELERNQKVTEFLNGIQTMLKQPKDSISYKYSSIWQPLIKELQVLQKDTLTATQLYLYSDLQENATWFSVYRESDLRLLKKNPDEVKELFMQKASNLVRGNSNVKVTVVYRPKNINENLIFQNMVELYTALFMELKIPIEFKANIN